MLTLVLDILLFLGKQWRRMKTSFRSQYANCHLHNDQWEVADDSTGQWEALITPMSWARGLWWSPDPASDTTHHRGTAIMMTEDLMTTNIRGERPNLSYRDGDVITFQFIPQQPVRVLKRTGGRFYVVVFMLPRHNWEYIHGVKDAGALTIEEWG